MGIGWISVIQPAGALNGAGDGGGEPEPTAPDQFGSGDWSVADDVTSGDITITITALPDDGGSDITDLEYQLDGGSWVSLSDTTTGDYPVSGLTDDQEYDVAIRAVNAVGNGTASATKAVTPTAPAFSPIDLTPIAWYDPSDLTTLFQDSAMTTPVTTDGDVVGAMLDKSGNGIDALQGTLANKWRYKTDGSLHWLEGDNVDDRIGAAFAGGTLVASTDVCFGARRNAGNVAPINTAAASTNPAVAIGQDASALSNVNAAGTPVHRVNGVALSAETRDALHDAWTAATDKIIEVDGADMSAWTGFGMACDSGSHKTLDRVYGVVVTPALSAGDATSLREWMATKSGVTL